ncbi:hypothetical protein NGRA_1258, partial [Nosema granulosis]
LRSKAILEVERKNSTHFSQINAYLRVKYNLKEEPDLSLDVIRSKKRGVLYVLYDEINKKHQHKKLYSQSKNPTFSMKDFSFWCCMMKLTKNINTKNCTANPKILPSQ